MNHDTESAYGLWSLVLINSLVFIVFAFSFTRPKTTRDWRSLGGFSAFIIALFTEMYGFPLTIYFLSGWLRSRFPQVNFLAHDSGHLWHSLFGLKGNPHWDIFHVLSSILIIAGFSLLASAWRILLPAQQTHTMATTGPYARIRHPQYAGFVVIMFGFLLQWPTIPTLVMFPILLWFYASLAKKEEADVRAEFGIQYDAYATNTPAFFPRMRGTQEPERSDRNGHSIHQGSAPKISQQ